ncbi:CaiB/BaiF CoA transferase family protein, partial [Gordonibacter sp.]
MSDGIFKGIRILEITQTVGVDLAGRLFADQGAEVIKIEKPGVGDPVRCRYPFAGDVPDRERSLVFAFSNTSKKSVALDIDTAEGVQAVKELLKTCDVFVREGDPSYFERIGLSYAELSKSNPALIVSSSTSYGEGNSLADWAANSFTLAHFSGETALYPHCNDCHEMAPTILGGNFQEYDEGPVLFAGIVAALLWRQNHDNRGQYLETSSLEARMVNLFSESTFFPVTGYSFDRYGAQHREKAQQCQPTKDGWINPAPAQPYHWQKFAKIIGKEEWIEEEWFNDVTERGKRNIEIMEAIRAWSSQHTKKECVDACQAERIPFGPVATIKDVVESEQFNER